MKNISVERLEKLKQEVILKNLMDINLDKNKNLYEVMMKDLFQGNLDEYFLSNSLKDVEEDEKKEIFQLGREYQGLCFYKGEFFYWTDSIDGVYLNDLDLVCARVLDNYDYLLGLIKDGGEEVVKMILPFQTSFMGKEGSVIEYLRNTFMDDSVLKSILLEMVKKDGIFKDLDTQEKRLLCTYPEGVLFYQKNGKIEMRSFDKIKEEVLEPFSKSDLSFEDYIFNLYSQYKYSIH